MHSWRQSVGSFCLLPLVALISIEQASAADATQLWPQWRGPHRDSTLDLHSHPNSLQQDELKLSWSVPLGPSYSGPIVAEDRVFVTETKHAKSEVVTALALDTGKFLWQQSWEGAMSVPFFAKENGDWIRSTPAYDGQSLYVAGMRDVLVAMDAATGAIRWRRDFVSELQGEVPAFGGVASPLVDGEALYVQAASSVMKLDKRTGHTLWRALADGGGMMGGAFSSPIICELAGRRQLVVQTRERLAGVDLDSGAVLWEQEVPAFRGMNILTPSKYGDAIFTASYQGGAFLYEVSPDGQQFTANELWKNNAQGYMSSPVIIGEHVYLHLKNQRFACLNLKSGKRAWTTEPFGKYWSMIALGDDILALDETGELLLIAVDPAEFRLMDRRKVSETSTWAHLALANGRVFVRSLDALLCFTWEVAQP